MVPVVKGSQPRTPREQLMVDSLLDNVLVTVQKEIARSMWDVATLPDIESKQGQFSLTGTQGCIHSLSSIARSSASFISYGDGNVSLSTAFTLQTLEIRCAVQVRCGCGAGAVRLHSKKSDSMGSVVTAVRYSAWCRFASPPPPDPFKSPVIAI